MPIPNAVRVRMHRQRKRMKIMRQRLIENAMQNRMDYRNSADQLTSSSSAAAPPS